MVGRRIGARAIGLALANNLKKFRNILNIKSFLKFNNNEELLKIILCAIILFFHAVHSINQYGPFLLEGTLKTIQQALIEDR